MGSSSTRVLSSVSSSGGGIGSTLGLGVGIRVVELHLLMGVLVIAFAIIHIVMVHG